MDNLKMEQKEEIRNIALSAGADVCGFANIDRINNAPEGFAPTDIYKDCRSVLVLGLALSKGLSQVPPQLIYNYFNNNIVTMVDDLLLRVAKKIENEFDGFAVPLPSDMAGSWNEETKTAHVIARRRYNAETQFHLWRRDATGSFRLECGDPQRHDIWRFCRPSP